MEVNKPIDINIIMNIDIDKQVVDAKVLNISVGGSPSSKLTVVCIVDRDDIYNMDYITLSKNMVTIMQIVNKLIDEYDGKYVNERGEAICVQICKYKIEAYEWIKSLQLMKILSERGVK
jgi:hypothetical protein